MVFDKLDTKETEWLLFIAQLPARPSSLRVKIWRQLREAGAVSLQNGVWVLPGDKDKSLFLERLSADVRMNHASAQIFRLVSLDPASQADVIAHFMAQRDREYMEFIRQSSHFIVQIDQAFHDQQYNLADLERYEKAFERLRKWLVKVQKRDFFPIENSLAAVTAIRDCRQRLYDYTRQVYAHEGFVTPLNDLP
jgi:DNA-binding transcriptional regulator PaaX